MTLDVPTTINGWIQQPGPINLRVARPQRNHDLRAAEGIFLATVTGVAIIAWTVALIRWLL
jgi:hypothetical protein